MSISNIQGYRSTQEMQGMFGMQGMGGMGGMRPEQSLTDDQKTEAQSILSQYDAENINEEDAQSIFDQLREAGIQPGKDLDEVIEEAGFDSDELRSLGMPAFQMPPGMGGMQESSQITEEQVATVQSVLANYDPENVTASDAKAIFSQLNEAGVYPTAGLKEAIEDAGFDADSLRDQALSEDSSLENYFWAIKDTSTQDIDINTTLLQSLKSILDQYDFSSSLTSDQEDTLIQQLSSYSLLGSGTNLSLSI